MNFEWFRKAGLLFSTKAWLSMKIVTNVSNTYLDTTDWDRVYSGPCTSAGPPKRPNRKRIEAAFRAMKSPLAERPVFHQLQHRTRTHIFLCVLAYHLLMAIRKPFLDRGVLTSWWTLRQQLSTHQVVTVLLPTGNGQVL
jgi:hypothetical protein